MKWKLIPLAIVVSMFCLIACVSAGAGDDNDATYPEVGIEWVVNYDWPSDDLPNADDDARSFYNTLGSNGWTKRFDYGDSSTQVYHWTYSNDLNYVDKVSYLKSGVVLAPN